LFPADQALPVSTASGNLPKLDYGPIVESLRVKAGDASAALPAVDAALHVRFIRSCIYWTELTLHDGRGNELFYADEIPTHPLINISTRMPVGSAWYLTLDAGDGVQNPVVQLGPIQPDGSGSPVDGTATIDCSQHSGTLALTGTASPTPIPTHAAPSSAPSAVLGTASPPSVPPADPSTTSAGSIAAPAIALLVLGALVVAFLLRRRIRSS
jgi:MYXO-CTERM domain-containing protein